MAVIGSKKASLFIACSVANTHALRDMPNAQRQSGNDLSTGRILLMAFACGAMVANLYYAQTLVGEIGPEVGLSTGVAGLIVTLTQLGYGIGLFLIVQLGDLFENRRLTVLLTYCTFIGCLGIALSQGPVTFLIASLVTGICTTGAQVLLPMASHFSPPGRQGRTIGQIMSGLLAGIMLARPLASFITEHLGWRAVFWFSAELMVLIGTALNFALPRRVPPSRRRYWRDPRLNGLAGTPASAVADARTIPVRALCRLQFILDGRAAGSGAPV